ncbi:hypothetical protein BDA96_03G034000 [Sorghum bicolor]|uniref:Uncharacterized protein n=2 Tax=Sorghum bicolor TaxID=4558 RepID=A0A921UL41_SORBI|nr:hypothetical protein BDA96_03G034000 [Sorghum bicolor]KXG31615.2 hypothetical protein SORBI_3003G031001 [Sorghum bicolor]
MPMREDALGARLDDVWDHVCRSWRSTRIAAYGHISRRWGEPYLFFHYTHANLSGSCAAAADCVPALARPGAPVALTLVPSRPAYRVCAPLHRVRARQWSGLHLAWDSRCRDAQPQRSHGAARAVMVGWPWQSNLWRRRRKSSPQV